MPAKTTTTAEKRTSPGRRRASPGTPRARRRRPSHDEISRRAYFIYLQDGGDDEFANWLRAERELMAA